MNVISTIQLHLVSEAMSEKRISITAGYADMQVLNTAFEIEEEEDIPSTEVVKPRSRHNTYKLKQSVQELLNCIELPSKENVEKTNKSAKQKKAPKTELLKSNLKVV